MRKAPRVGRGAKTGRIYSDQAVHALVWEPVPVPIVQVIVDVVSRAQVPGSTLKPKAQEISLAAKPMMNKLA